MKSKLIEYLNRVSLKGTENRYRAIIDILDELNIEYRIQDMSHSYEVPVYKPSNQIFGQLSLFDEDNFSLTSGLKEDIEYNPIDHSFMLMYAQELGIEIPQTDTDEDEFNFLVEALKETDYFECFENDSLEKSIPEVDYYQTHYISIKNIIISFANKCENRFAKKVVFTAHYDVVFNSTGANDNGSAISILLCLINEVNSLKSCDYIYEFVFLDKEETGGTGCTNYLSSCGDNVVEIFNLDTCGVGNHIVVSDYSRHDDDISSLLLTKDIKGIFNVIETDSLPYCDSDIMKRQNRNVITICTLPDSDVDYFRKIVLNREKKRNLLRENKLSTISNAVSKLKSKIAKTGRLEVFDYIHNGKFDDISFINYDIMVSILRYLLLIIK